MPISNIKQGNNVKIPQPGLVNLYGCSIGDNTMIGAFVEIQKGAKVGRNCKIESHSFICDGVDIGDNVFVGHGVMFINDRHPKCSRNWTLEHTLIKNNVSIGSGATIMCGITIGEGALIGAGSVVTKNVPPGETWVGNPARKI